MSTEPETQFPNKENQENKSPAPTRSIKKNLFKEGVLDGHAYERDPTSSEKKTGRRALAEITNELKAKQNQRYNVPSPHIFSHF
jgi:hypothetical protein